MMPFLSFPLSFSSVYLSCQNSRSFWMLSDTWCGLGCPVQGQGWTLRIPWIPSSSGHSLCCPFNSHQLCLLCFPRQTKEVRPSKVWISSRWELWPCRHSWIAQTSAEKNLPHIIQRVKHESICKNMDWIWKFASFYTQLGLRISQR